MKLMQTKLILAAGLLGGVLTACESEYDPTAADANRPPAENQEKMPGEVTTDSDITDNGAAAENTDSNPGSSTYSDTPRETDDQAAREEYGINNDRDDTSNTGRWQDAGETADTSANPSPDESGDNVSDDNVSDEVQSDVLAIGQQSIQFEFDSAELTGEAKSQLQDFVASIEEQDPQAVELVIRGYTDASGPEEYNQRLAGKRAEAVKSYLQEQGMPSDNLKVEAIGENESEDVAPASEEDSRRVVVEVVTPDAEELTAN